MERGHVYTARGIIYTMIDNLYIGQHIRLKRDITNTEEWCITKKIQEFADLQIVLTIQKVREGSTAFTVEELSSSTFIDIKWVDYSYNHNYFNNDLFTL